jgi:hypothetical protein
MTTTLDTETVAAELRKLAAEQPDFIYHDSEIYKDDGVCRYTDYEGNPSCIVGHVVKRVLGDEALAKLHSLEESVGEFGVRSTYWPDEFGGDDATLTLLVETQNKQDGGLPWKEAVNAALYGLDDI